MSHRAPDSLTFLPDHVMLKTMSRGSSSVFSNDVRSPSAPTTRPYFSLFYFTFSNNSFMFNQLCQLVFVFSLHPNLFQPITELARHSSLDARSFPPFFTFSFLSLLANLWGPLVSPILSLPWAIWTHGRVPARCAASSLLDKFSAPCDPPFSLRPRPPPRTPVPRSLCVSPSAAPPASPA
jgi:hypothetical protein